jgi:hypothetical protein
MDNYQSLRDLEARRAGPFTYQVNGEMYFTPDPVDVAFEPLLGMLHDKDFPFLPRMRVWQIGALFERWAAHYDLPDFQSAQRLAYVVNRYRDALENDLHIHARANLTELWRSRQWRFLLNLIDHLPRNCYYSEAVANDPEHARMIFEALSKQEPNDEAGPAGPPLHTWSAEVAAIVDLTDAVRRVEYAVIAVAAGSGGGRGPKPPEPLPRPSSQVDMERKRADHRARQARHESLAMRVLPHKRKKADAEH